MLFLISLSTYRTAPDLICIIVTVLYTVVLIHTSTARRGKLRPSLSYPNKHKLGLCHPP
jgi:hypothetical protein